MDRFRAIGNHVRVYISCVLFLALVASAQTPRGDSRPWIQLGPEGGDARSLASDPHNSSRILLGTSAGELYQSLDDGHQWSRFAHLGGGNDLVLDHIAFDPRDSKVIYVAGWSVENTGGDIFASRDGGTSWAVLPGMHGKSVRAMALAPSDPNIIIAGALDGVYRSRDAGRTWRLISPPNSSEIHNIESIAIDPRNPDAIYAGTWHLPWKTDDGGAYWHWIKDGIIDDSDVFSIKVDPIFPQTVYLSACSGIYKSENAGGQFHKVQGIPATARRTRVLQQDPSNVLNVYAGTTEGLWKSVDAGKTWKLMGPSNLIVNDVLVDPVNPKHVLLATDRSGVLSSDDGGATAVASNRGFSHRLVSAMVASADGQKLYAGVVNDKQFGGVFSSSDAGAHWAQVNDGLAGEDIFTLAFGDDGSLVAGTNHGVFLFDPQANRWTAKNMILNETFTPVEKKIKKKVITTVQRNLEKGELRGPVWQIVTSPERWIAATPSGLYMSLDHANSWHGGAIEGETSFVSVSTHGDRIAAATASKLLFSSDGGKNWDTVHLPSYVTRIYSVSLEPNRIWIVSHEGASFSANLGAVWQHVIVGMPAMQVVSVRYDAAHERTLAVASNGEIFASTDGHKWTRAAEPGRTLRTVTLAGDRIYGITPFSGIVAEPAAQGADRSAASAMIGKR